MTATLVETRNETLVITIDADVVRLSDLVDALNSLQTLYQYSWRFNNAIDIALRGGTASPAADPIARGAPTLLVKRIVQGSLLLELVEDPNVVGVATSLVGGGALWMLLRVLRRSPKALSEFVAEVTAMPETFRARRAALRTDAYRLQKDEIEARLDALDAHVKSWFVAEASEAFWTNYQTLINATQDAVEVKMVDEKGGELPEPKIE